MIIHNCKRLVQVISFILENQATAKIGWVLDYLVTDKTTSKKEIEIRQYSKAPSNPLFYTGACVPPNLIKQGTESLTVKSVDFPVIKAEGQITGCNVDDQLVDKKTGQVIEDGKQRFDLAFNEVMAELFDGLKATHILEVISVLKTGGYVLKDTENSNVGTIDYGRADELKNIDLVGGEQDWGSLCASPMKSIKDIVRQMRKYNAVANGVDVIYGAKAWEAMQAHEDRKAIAHHQGLQPTFVNDAEEFADIEYMGASEGNKFRHWVSTAEYVDYDGKTKPFVEDGEIVIVSRNGFGLQRIFRNRTSDEREQLPPNAKFFVYDDLDKEYSRKCRTFNPWLEEYHLLVPANVNGACVVKVVADDFNACIPCDKCDDDKPANGNGTGGTGNNNQGANGNGTGGTNTTDNKALTFENWKAQFINQDNWAFVDNGGGNWEAVNATERVFVDKNSDGNFPFAKADVIKTDNNPFPKNYFMYDEQA